MTITADTQDQISRFIAITLKSGLRLYDKTGMKPNRSWTPSAMLKKATEFTGVEYKRGQYELAATHIDEMLEGKRVKI